MSSIINIVDNQYLLDRNGDPTGARIIFYYSGTTTLAPIYSDPDLTVRTANPVDVVVGDAVPKVYLDTTVSYRRVVTYSDGSVNDLDPVNSAVSFDFLPITGGTLTGDLSVQGNLYTTGRITGISPNSGTTGGVVVRDAAGNPDAAFLQFTNNAGLSQYGWLKGNAAGSLETSAGFKVRGLVQLIAADTSKANINIPVGVDPTAPNDGDIWRNSTGLMTQLGSSLVTLAGITGQTLATPGYIKLSNGLMIQWGQSRGSGLSVTFPQAFTGTPFAFFHSNYDPSNTYNPSHLGLATLTTTGATLNSITDDSGGGSILGFDWLVIGV